MIWTKFNYCIISFGMWSCDIINTTSRIRSITNNIKFPFFIFICMNASKFYQILEHRNRIFQIKILEKSTFKKIPPKSISSKVLLDLRFSPFDKSSQIKMPKEKLMLVMLHCRRRCCCCCLPSFKERRNWLSFVHRRPGSYWD